MARAFTLLVALAVALVVALASTGCGEDPPGEVDAVGADSVSQQLPLERLELTPSDPAQPPAPFVRVTLKEQLRNAQELTEGTLLTCDLGHTRGATLRFGYGLSQTPRRRGRPLPNEEPVKLMLSIESPDGGSEVFSEVYPFPTGGSGQAHWLDASVALEELGQGPLRATFRIDVGYKQGVVAAIASPRLERPRGDAPTVLLITSDTHRADHVGALGEAGVGVQTPALDRLAARGVLFTDCYSCTNFTSPSHVSIMTSLPVRDTGVIDNTMRLSDDALTVAEVFRDAGYMTLAAVSVSHLRDHISGLGQGFDRMHAPQSGEAQASQSVDALLEYLDSEAGVPVFAWLHIFDAHTPYDPPEELARLYYPDDRDPSSASPNQPAGFAGVSWAKGIQDFDYIVAQYKSQVTHLDDELARLLERERIGRGVIAFTADHGEVMGGHGVFFNHKGIYPDTLAVPLILAWPDAPRGRQVTQAVSHEDLGRTLIDLAGVEAANFPGQSLSRFVENEPDAEPRFAISDGAKLAAIESEGWLLVLALKDITALARVRHQVELYNLSDDPACVTDLVTDEHDRARDLRARLIAWLSEGRGHLVHESSDDPEVLRELAALGYSGGDEDEDREEWYRPDPRSPWCQRFEGDR